MLQWTVRLVDEGRVALLFGFSWFLMLTTMVDETMGNEWDEGLFWCLKNRGFEWFGEGFLDID